MRPNTPLLFRTVVLTPVTAFSPEPEDLTVPDHEPPVPP